MKAPRRIRETRLSGEPPAPASEASAHDGGHADSGTPANGSGITRRSFLGSVGVGVALAGIGSELVTFASPADAATTAPALATKRRVMARKVRTHAATLAYAQALPKHLTNNEEEDYPYVANFSKGLAHNVLGEVDAAAYAAVLRALSTGVASDFEAIPLGGTAKLRNPQAGLAFDLEGPDSHALAIRPAPRIDAAENSGEMAELYWMALARDVAFTDYGTSPLIAAAGADLSSMSDFRGPKVADTVTPGSIFRGPAAGELFGPYVSQFLLKDIPYGSLTISQRQRTLAPITNYMTAYSEWADIENGGPAAAPQQFDSTPRHMRNGRDLAAYVQVDALYEAYLNACLILLAMNAPFDAGNPYAGYIKTDAFATFGGPHVLTLVTEAA
ncbi:MAG: twin-arginine translocation signal domain-containing protein, partial [Gammaproteobacteria bacterium]